MSLKASSLWCCALFILLGQQSEGRRCQTSETVADLRAAIVDDSSQDFSRILATLLDKQAANLHTRVGLVPNYFMTRGEAIPLQETFRSFQAFGRKATEQIFKLFHQQDFREEDAIYDFSQIMEVVRDAAAKNDTSFDTAIRSVLNRQWYNKDGNSFLQILINRRHLRFTRKLLLHASKYLDLDQRNRKGYSAWDLANDRLEVETVYLLLLHGATASIRTNASSSLGYREWTAYDMIANLDTGRWLHKQSEEAIMEYARREMTPQLRDALIRWATITGATMHNETLEAVGKMPRLFAIVLADGCDAITNHEAWATLIRHLALLRSSNLRRASNPVGAFDSTGDIQEATLCDDLYGFLESKGADTSKCRVAGRTLFYNSHDGGEIAVKFSKSSEDAKTPHPLAKEAAMNTRVGALKREYELRSEYPETIQLLRLTQVSDHIRHDIEGQQSKGYHPFSVSTDDDGVVALVYRAPEGYGLYINDPSLSLEACRSGIAKATYDTSVLARHGLYHGALVDIQHDSTREQRPHLWSFESFLTRFRGGAGRIDRGFAGLAAPNVRVSGLADLKHLINATQVKWRYDPSVIHAQHNIVYDDEERFQLALIEQLGAGLFATALLTASSWQSRQARGDSENMDLPKELKTCFAMFLCGYLQMDESRAHRFLDLVGTDFQLMAQQFEMFATPKYVQVAETAPRRPIFGVAASVMGFFTHPTALVHFCQRGSLNLDDDDKAGRSLAAIKEVYQPSQMSVADLPRIDTSMMRSSPTWKRGRGWDSPQGQPHFGSYEGVLPFQQLIRDLYAVVHLAWLIRASEDSFEILQ